MYTEKVLDHFSNPRNMGEVEGANGVGMVGNAKCGDIMQMFIKVNDDGIIEDKDTGDRNDDKDGGIGIVVSPSPTITSDGKMTGSSTDTKNK